MKQVYIVIVRVYIFIKEPIKIKLSLIHYLYKTLDK